jgi:arginyl-tRNA synthetase
VFEGEVKGTFERSEGAIGVNLEAEDLGFFMLLKSDGNTLYATKDLALAQRKFDKFGVKRSIYVVGAEQTLHFKQIFATLKRRGYSQVGQRNKNLFKM